MNQTPKIADVKLFNTLSRKVEDFRPLESGRVKMYACGPTVYNYAHIGNMRTYIVEDVLRRALAAAGYQVTHVMNITDVGHLQSDADSGEDKMSLASQREKQSPWVIARNYEKAFFRHSDLLNISRPDTICRATEHIEEIIAMVTELVEKGFAYSSGGNVYFDIDRFPSYTDFAGLQIEAQQQSDRVVDDPNKRNQADFALWFSKSKFPNQIMKWESPWGVGFPGWHIECSAMASKYLGDRIDIHCGGIDHVRVHHTNEIAQSEACFGHQWVNFWFHCEFLKLDAEKMSKSAGEFLTVDSLTELGFNPIAYRYLVLGAHYRGILNFSLAALESAAKAYERLQNRVVDLKSEANGGEADSISPEAEAAAEKFWTALFNDLHTPTAVSHLWSIVRSRTLCAADKLSLLARFDDVLGLRLAESERAELTPEQQQLLEQRAAARQQKNWQEADRLRDLLLAQGVEVKDSQA